MFFNFIKKIKKELESNDSNSYKKSSSQKWDEVNSLVDKASELKQESFKAFHKKDYEKALKNLKASRKIRKESFEKAYRILDE